MWAVDFGTPELDLGIQWEELNIPFGSPFLLPDPHSVKWDFRQATRWSVSVSRVFGQAGRLFLLIRTRRGCGQTCAYSRAADMYLGVRAFQLWETFSPYYPTHRHPL